MALHWPWRGGPPDFLPSCPAPWIGAPEVEAADTVVLLLTSRVPDLKLQTRGPQVHSGKAGRTRTRHGGGRVKEGALRKRRGC